MNTSNGPYVVAGDAVMWYSNVEEMWPSGYTNGNTYNMLMTYGQIHTYLGGDVDRIIPGHDPLVFSRHPSWKVGANEVGEVHLAEWDSHYTRSPPKSPDLVGHHRRAARAARPPSSRIAPPAER